MKKIYFKSNLKHLIKIYNDSNLELALYLGFTSESTISNWFNKKEDYYPTDTQIIDKICFRYTITKDLLLYEDLSSIKTPFLFDLPDDKLIELHSFLLPLISPKENDSELFKQAFYKHKELLKQTKVGAETTQLYFEYMDLYEKAYEKDDSLPALANTLSSIVHMRTGIAKENVISAMFKYRNKKISKKSFSRDYILNIDNQTDSDNDNIDQNEIKQLDTCIMKIIAELKGHADFQQFADYYLAIRYRLNIADSDLDEATSFILSENLLLDLVRLNNIYAINYLTYFNELIKKYLNTSQPVKAK